MATNSRIEVVDGDLALVFDGPDGSPVIIHFGWFNQANAMLQTGNNRLDDIETRLAVIENKLGI